MLNTNACFNDQIAQQLIMQNLLYLKSRVSHISTHVSNEWTQPWEMPQLFLHIASSFTLRISVVNVWLKQAPVNSSIHACMHACMHICVYVCMFVCMCVWRVRGGGQVCSLCVWECGWTDGVSGWVMGIDHASQCFLAWIPYSSIQMHSNKSVSVSDPPKLAFF
jgi:hypothetical protein